MPSTARPVSGRVVFITGAARGIGAAAAKRLTARGAAPTNAAAWPGCALDRQGRREAPAMEAQMLDVIAREGAAAASAPVGAGGAADSAARSGAAGS